MRKYSLFLSMLTIVFAVVIVPITLADAPIEDRSGRAELRFLEGMIDHHQMALDMANDCLAKASTESVMTICQNIINAQSAEIVSMQGWLLDWHNVEYSPMSMNDNMAGMGMSQDSQAQMEQMQGMMDMMMGMDMSAEMHTQMEQMGGMMDMMMSGETMQGMDKMSMMEQMDGMMDMMMGMDMSAEMHTQMEQMGGMMDMMMGGAGEMDHGGTHTEEMPATDPAMMMGMMAGLNRLEGVDYEIAWLESMIDHHDDAIHMSERILERAPEGTGHSELRGMAQQIINDQTAEIEAMEMLITEFQG
jgi:uncharacterized protein (DUF305 family)